MKSQIFAALLIAMLMMTLFTGCALSAEPNNAEEAAKMTANIAEEAVEKKVAPIKNPEEYPEFRIYTIDPNAPVEVNIPDEAVPMAQAPDVAAYDAAEPLTKRDAEAIALQNAGFDTNQVSFLYTKYEVDDGIPQYDVQFKESGVEYEFEIHAETGEILSFEKGD